MIANEDFVTIEDMTSQPRTLPGGRTIEYGPTYQQLRAIIHGTSGNLVGDFHKDTQGGTLEFIDPRLEVAAILRSTSEKRRRPFPR